KFQKGGKRHMVDREPIYEFSRLRVRFRMEMQGRLIEAAVSLVALESLWTGRAREECNMAERLRRFREFRGDIERLIGDGPLQAAADDDIPVLEAADLPRRLKEPPSAERKAA